MAISDDNKYLLNNKMGAVAHKVQLGTLIEAAEEGGLAAGAVALANLATGIVPSHVVKFAGKHTSTANGGGVNAVTVTGVAATDVVIATLQTAGSTPRTILTAIPTTNTITVTFSGDPSTDHIVSYMVLRAAA